MIKQYDQLVKLILIGGSGVGKSSILMQFAENKFTENYLTTIGVDFRFKTVDFENKKIKFQIWDTAGQQRFRTITSAYYKGADGILMVYDLTEPASLDDLETFWIPEAYNYCDKGIKVLVLGNKSDCDRSVNPEKVKKLVEKYGFDAQEVSAKNGDKVHEVIRNFGVSIAKQKMQKNGVYPSSAPSTSSSNSSVASSNSTKQVEVKEAPKQANTTLTIKAKKNVPSYQKKCC